MSKKIFIVNNDSNYAGELVSAFKGTDISPVIYETANEAIAAATSNAPDLVVTAAMLEDLGSGFRLAKWIKTNVDIPVVMISGIDELTGLDFSSRAGSGDLFVDAYLSRPAEVAVVVEKVQTLLS
ncbi:response regulator [bacterium]|nr:response regulator [bacterium]